jgi:hypothetical protein
MIGRIRRRYGAPTLQITPATEPKDNFIGNDGGLLLHYQLRPERHGNKKEEI